MRNCVAHSDLCVQLQLPRGRGEEKLSEATATAAARNRPLDWPAIAFIVGTPLAAAVLAPLHLITVGLTPGLALFAALYTVACSLAITAGYHRLFSHCSYRAAAAVRLAYLLLGAAGWQNSALHWALRHRRHHRYEGTERDPYNIRAGFFHAHVGWIGRKYSVQQSEFPADLRGDPLVVWQHRHYFPLAVGMGFALPALVGIALGSWWGGLVWGGLVRVVFTHHCSFLVNSWAHRFGARPYSLATTGRDSTAAALLTYGEGFHNFHHVFPYDYRNGVRWFHWDPTKWMIRALGFVGLASGLRRAPQAAIERAKRGFSKAEPPPGRFSPPAVFAYVLLHLGSLGVVYTGINGEALAVFCGAYLFRVFGSSIAYHRYFAHRSFRTSRLMQFILGAYGAMTVLGGPLWWAQTHRYHHRYADTPGDIHSPHHQGFLYAHFGWFLERKHRAVDLLKVPDLARFPELVWLERHGILLQALYVACVYWLFGAVGIVWGFFLPSVLILQMTHWIQSISHCLGGYRRYPILDDSRNHWLFGVLSMGEGFHHNHHCFPSSARMGLRWWEIDVSYYVLLMASRLGLVWDLHLPNEQQRAGRCSRTERHVTIVQAEVHSFRSQLERFIDALDTAACAGLKERLAMRLDAFAARLRDLLISGPFALQHAFEVMRDELRGDAVAALSAAPDSTRLEQVLKRIDAPISLSASPQPA